MNRHSGSYKGDGAKKEKQGTLQAFAKEITDRIANFVVQDMRPVYVIEGQGFLKMLAYLEPGYKVPTLPQSYSRSTNLEKKASRKIE